jgi:trimeric autotransporter adhesin
MKVAVRLRSSQFPVRSFGSSKIQLLFVLCAICAACVHAQSRGAFVYTGNSPWGAPTNELVRGYVINSTSGTLSTASGTPLSAGGQVLAIAAHPSGKFAYVATANGTVSAYTVDSYAGTLTPIPGSPFATSGGNPAALAIDPAGKYLYAAGGNQLYGFAIDSSSGALSALPGSPYSSTGALGVAVDPSGQYLVVSNGSGAWTYAITSSTGALTAVSSMVPGCGGTRIAFEPSGHFLYGSYGGITACSFSSTSGGLMPVSGSPFGSGLNISGVAAHSSGAFLYASENNCVNNGPSTWLHGYVINPSSGALTAITGSPFALPGGSGCYYDEDVATEASGKFVYTVDANYGTAAYTVNQSTGALTLASSSFYSSSPGAFTVTTVPNAISSTATLTGLQIVPGTAQIGTSTLGKQYQFTVKGTYSDGSTGFLTGSATWTSSSPSVATIAAGLATSTGYGTTTITAAYSGVSTTATLTVTTPALTSISVTPQSTTIYNGTAIQLKATGLYADGSSVDLTNSVTWSTSNNTIATVSAQGLVQSLAIGNVTVSAVDTVTGTTSVNVVAAFSWGATGSNGTSASVTSGGSANFGLALAPTQSFAGLVTFACSNPPSNSTCSVDPPSAILANGLSANVTVTITTGQTLTGQNQQKTLRWNLALAILPAMVLLFPTKRNRWAHHTITGILLLVVLIACASCGGGSQAANTGSGGSGSGGSGGSGGGGSTANATPPGTYTVVVTASTADHAKQNINLTVQVQ